MDITDLTSLLQSAAPYSGAITALADLGIDITQLIKPDQAQTYDQAAKDRLTELDSILSQADSAARADKLCRFFTQLCIDAGAPAIGLGGDISVPVAFLLSLAAAAIKSIRDGAVLNDALLGAKQAGVQPVTAPAKA